MWRRRIALVTVMVIVTSVAGVAAPTPVTAWAATRGEQIFGDLNGDGFVDRITLGVVQPDFCAVITEYGLAGGGFRQPVAAVYLKPGGVGPATRCPEVGVTADLTDDGREELIVAWWAGPPPTVPYELMVLDAAFQPAFGLRSAVFAPTYLGTADFTGNGRQDVYAITDQGEGIATFLNPGDGTLVPGPIEWCARPIDLELHDFDRDGATDVLDAHLERCDTNLTAGVVVLFDSGAVQQLQHDPVGYDSWTATVTDADDDGLPDVRTVSLRTGDVDYFINDGTGRFVASPHAESDTVTLTGTRAVAIDVLANDFASRDATITVITPPRYGDLRFTSDRRIIYTPRAGHGETDRFTYQLSEEGRRSNATVYLRFTG
jgi:hypothetical protein